HLRAALDEAYGAALALDPHRITVERIDVRERDRGVEARADRADLDLSCCAHPLIGLLGHRLAARDAPAEDFSIVKALPDLLPGRGDPLLSDHLHGVRSLLVG